jgi:hypothetical protein
MIWDNFLCYFMTALHFETHNQALNSSLSGNTFTAWHFLFHRTLKQQLQNEKWGSCSGVAKISSLLVRNDVSLGLWLPNFRRIVSSLPSRGSSCWRWTQPELPKVLQTFTQWKRITSEQSWILSNYKYLKFMIIWDNSVSEYFGTIYSV